MVGRCLFSMVAILVVAVFGSAVAGERTHSWNKAERVRSPVAAVVMPECREYREFSKQRKDLIDGVDSLNSKGRARKAECMAMPDNLRGKCLDDLVPLRHAVRAKAEKLDSLRMRYSGYSGQCNEEQIDRRHEIERLEPIADEACSGGSKPDSVRCEDALFRLSTLYYQEDMYENRQKRERYDADYQRWRSNIYRD